MPVQHPLANQEIVPPTYALLRGLWSHLSRRRRIQLGLHLILMIFSGIAELVSLGAVLPFLSVLSDPEPLWAQPLVQSLARQLKFTSSNQLLLPATFLFIAAVLLSASIRLVNLWLNGRLAAAVGSDLSCEAYRRTLYQPYSIHVQRNSAAVITTIVTQIENTVSALNALLMLITSAFVAAGLLTGLLLIDSYVALATVVMFGFAYWVLALTSRRELRSNGQKIAQASRKQFQALEEGLGAIRDVLLDGSQTLYLNIYREADRPQRQLRAKNIFLGNFPRYVFEALGLIAISLMGAFLILQSGSGAAVIPLLGALALGAQRLLPALQQFYAGWSTLKGFNTAINDVLVMLSQPLPPLLGNVETPQLYGDIRLEKVYFCYGQMRSHVIQGLNLNISQGERIGLIGSTGSGKSTLVDLLMGLLTPSKGRLLVNETDINDPKHPELLSAWRSAIAHVPQSIYLADSSLAENIAFGIPRQSINMAQVKKAAAQAQIAGFIEADPRGYQRLVGERGIQLSGGQRQRIGLARAFYKKAQVIILDEATSALDTDTEKEIMKSIDGLSRNITVVLIAHRLTTLQSCDKIIELASNSQIRIMSPSELLSDHFRHNPLFDS